MEIIAVYSAKTLLLLYCTHQIANGALSGWMRKSTDYFDFMGMHGCSGN